jgi:hypothetical protein
MKASKSQFQPSIRVAFHSAKLMENSGNGEVVLEFPGLTPVQLDGMQDLQMVDPETGAKRKLTDDEIRDFEDAIESFVNLRVARQLKKFIRFTEPGRSRDQYGNPDVDLEPTFHN